MSKIKVDYFLVCLNIKAPNMIATANPENPGKRINKYKTPATRHKATINKKPCKKVSILNAAMSANPKKVKARMVKNIYKDAFSMLS
ncbi:hypothetical protein DBR43_28535 [Pedobacter sp. KBW06]|uniref:hypothetical protein n=1 Tax=Pedobacter sp. KBW06 TaxID=2153359 RepID=UPI000F5A43F9|nr:hypothetical protein [Pedobacter sp. KBW06]RQO66182.1 hypothetical protein DBR43_28535 [Pedobacter sp. KBW06]